MKRFIYVGGGRIEFGGAGGSFEGREGGGRVGGGEGKDVLNMFVGTMFFVIIESNIYFF